MYLTYFWKYMPFLKLLTEPCIQYHGLPIELSISEQVTCGTHSVLCFGVSAVTFPFLLCLIWGRNQVYVINVCLIIKGKIHTNIKIISYDCESLIYFSSNWYCTFLVLLGMYVTFTVFQQKVVSISLDQGSLISFSFALFISAVVILFIPVLTI